MTATRHGTGGTRGTLYGAVKISKNRNHRVPKNRFQYSSFEFSLRWGSQRGIYGAYFPLTFGVTFLLAVSLSYFRCHFLTAGATFI